MDQMPARYAAMVLLAAWCAPRFGELTELRRRDLRINSDKGIPVDGSLTVTQGRGLARTRHPGGQIPHKPCP